MKIKTIYPDYFNDFKCSASECSDHCCKEWGITIDKSTYKKLKKGNLGMINGVSCLDYRDRSTFTNYAMIKLNSENKLCPYYSEDGLCVIQKKLGHEALSEVCKTYPRLYRDIAGQMEASLSTSCIEAANLILSKKEGISFCEEELDIPKNVPLIGTNMDKDNSVHSCFWSIRVFMIQVLQCRDMSMAERLAVLGMFAMQCNELNTEVEIEDLILEYKSRISNDIYVGAFNSLSSNKDALFIKQVTLLVAIQLEIIRPNGMMMSYVSIVEKIEKLFDCDEADESFKVYKNVSVNRYEDFMEKNSYLIENYLVNYIFSKAIPIHKSFSIYELVALIMLRAAMIKMNIIVGMMYEENLDEAQIIEIIASTSKQLDNNESMSRFMLKVLEEEGYMALEYLLTMSII